MIDPSQLRIYVIRPTLNHINLGGLAAENLLLGTAIQESGLVYLHQLGSGPALGLWQMEPATHNDLWSSFLAGRQPLESRVRELMTGQDDLEQLVSNLVYACAMCRIKYLQAPQAIPDAKDANALAIYWKMIYNTPLGAGVATEAVPKFQQAIAA